MDTPVASNPPKAVTDSKSLENLLEIPFSPSSGSKPICTPNTCFPPNSQVAMPSKEGLVPDFQLHVSHITTRTPVQLKEACMELLSILFRQDVTGFFHFPFKETKDPTHSLRHLERLILTDKIVNLSEFRRKIETLFDSASSYFPSTAPAVLEAARLKSIAIQWFQCLYNESLLSSETKIVDSEESKSVITHASVLVGEDDPFFSLNLLNPDNRGIISDTERVQNIGDEVGALTSGTHLAQFGGYREDRRNKVIPYTYLNYGPFASFGPTFDSGASNCTPEANQLLLGTCWQPARLLHLPLSSATMEPYSDERNDVISPFSRLTSSAAHLGDFDLSLSLSECEEEWQEGRKMAEELDAIIPPVGSGDDFSLYLANAIVRDLPPPIQHDLEMEKCSEVEVVQGDPPGLEQVSNLHDQDISDTLLKHSAQKLRNLYNAQYRRLGDYSVQSLSEEKCLQPSLCELENAYDFANDLVSIISNVRPCDVISRQSVRHHLGISDLPCFPVNDDDNEVIENTGDLLTPTLLT